MTQGTIPCKTYSVGYYLELGFTINIEAASPEHAERIVRERLDDAHDELPGSTRVHYDDGICVAAEEVQPATAPSNSDRAAWAQAALAKFIACTGADNADDAVCDLIADLGHYCQAHDLDFLRLIRRGVSHWAAEQQEAADTALPDVSSNKRFLANIAVSKWYTLPIIAPSLDDAEHIAHCRGENQDFDWATPENYEFSVIDVVEVQS